MDKTIEKGYYFSKNELLLLLGISRLEKIYMFPLPKQEDFGEQQFILTLHRLLKKGFLQWKERLIFSPEIEQIFLRMHTAALALAVIPQEEQMQRIYYISNQGIAAAELIGKKEEIRLSLLSDEDFFEKLFDEPDGFRQILETEESGLRMEQYHDFLSKEKLQFIDREEKMDFENFLIWSQREQMLSAWEFFCLKRRVLLKRLLFLEGSMNVWILDRTPEAIQIFYDSKQARAEIRQFIAEQTASNERDDTT